MEDGKGGREAVANDQKIFITGVYYRPFASEERYVCRKTIAPSSAPAERQPTTWTILYHLSKITVHNWQMA